MFKAYWSLEDVPEDQGYTALAIGNFDGLHRGHIEILERTKREARRLGGEAVVLTFDPHPTTVVRPEHAPALLMTPAERVRHFDRYGLDAAVVLAFTPEIASLSPADFVRTILVGKLRARSVVVGESFRFGHQQSGTLAVLRALGRDLNFETHDVRPVMAVGRTVSSTAIRELVRAGKVEAARRLLGRPFSVVGEVVPGKGIGSKQTVPTLNLVPDADVHPAHGVYVTLTCDRESGKQWSSVTNVGLQPTFNGNEQTIETYIIDPLEVHTFSRIEHSFLHRLRDERRFDSVEDLRQQILSDVESTKRYFRRFRSSKLN
ncbi:MAG: riboflavin biosynthesis protein RibF [Solibacterales bacterium]|nr:riboflavin biosynthesis protein RibF [Bryobacterales bacterium]|tara:strand:- start:15873 stop:16826 length:954 start_codon:yes stop_codon:yes gene_type:complete